MLGLGILGKVVGGALGYAGKRSKERTTALGAGLAAIGIYFRTQYPKRVPEDLMWFCVIAGSVIAVLSTPFMVAFAKWAFRKKRKSNRRK